MSRIKFSEYEVQDMVKRAMEIFGCKRKKDLANLFGILPQDLAGRIKRGTIINLIETEAYKRNVNFNYILTGEGDSLTSSQTPLLSDECACIEDFTFIPKYELDLAAGTGTYVISQNVEHQYAFRTEWLNRHCSKNNCGLFSVKGNSMLPGIGDSDMVLVDMSLKSMKDIIDGQIYAFSEGDLVKVKRLVWKGSALLAISDNRSEVPDPIEVDMRQFYLIGKVVWVGHVVR